MRSIFLFAILAASIAGCSSAPMTPAEKLVRSKDGCHTPLGFIPEGRSAQGYLHQVETNGQHCQQGVLTCNDGIWAGAYIYSSCVTTP